MHEPFPIELWYVPAEQLIQLTAPTPEYVPAEQAIHADCDVAPIVLEYVPTGHCVQVDAPAPEYVPMEHFVQLDAPAPEYVPAGQFTQLDKPESKYVPAVHPLAGTTTMTESEPGLYGKTESSGDSGFTNITVSLAITESAGTTGSTGVIKTGKSCGSAAPSGQGCIFGSVAMHFFASESKYGYSGISAR